MGEILPTPRHGKAVEVNAYWYNALRIMAEFSRKRDGDGTGYETLAEKVKESFTEAFWMEEKHCRTRYLRNSTPLTDCVPFLRMIPSSGLPTAERCWSVGEILRVYERLEKVSE